MQTLFTILIIISTSLRLWVVCRIIDHNTFSLMVDDDAGGRIRVDRSHNSSISRDSLLPNGSTVGLINGSLAASNSVEIMLNGSSSEVFDPHSRSWANESTAKGFLAAIRSIDSDSSVQHRPAAANETDVTALSRGYLKPGVVTGKGLRIISEVDYLPVVPRFSDGEASKNDIKATDESGQADRLGLRSIPGLNPVLSVNGVIVTPDTWLASERQATAGSDADLHKTTAPHLLTSSTNSLTGISNDMRQLTSASDRIGTGRTAWVKDSASIVGPRQGPNDERRRLDDRHYVHIRDSAPSPIVINNLELHPSGRRGHQDQVREGRIRQASEYDGNHGEIKKVERDHAIVKQVEEWRCLETGMDKIEKLVCPPGLMITSFGLASIGNPQGSCTSQDSRQPGSCHFDLSTTLRSRCAGQSVCEIDPIPSIDLQNHCSGRDPDPRAVIEYRCSPWVAKPILANSTLDHCQQIENNGTLQCPQGQAIIGFGFGFFGEIDGSCSKGISPGICSRNVMTDLTTQCVGRNQCRIDVSSNQFGTACNKNMTFLTLASSFKCGALADAVRNSTKIVGQSYVNKNLQFTKSNGADAAPWLIATSVTAMGFISMMI